MTSTRIESPQTVRKLSEVDKLVRVKEVDPRSVRWEIDHPLYRVYLWWTSVSATESHQGDASEEYELSGPELDATMVLSWAEERRVDRRADAFSAYVVFSPSGPNAGVGIARIGGIVR